MGESINQRIVLYVTRPVLDTHHLSERSKALQDDLKNSEAKGSGLERQVSQLSARVNKAGGSGSTGTGGGNGSGGGGGGGDTAGSGNVLGSGGESSARGPEVTEAEIAALRRQMKAATQVRGGRICVAPPTVVLCVA